MKKNIYAIVGVLLFLFFNPAMAADSTVVCDPANPSSCPSSTPTTVPAVAHVAGSNGAFAILNAALTKTVSDNVSVLSSWAIRWLSILVMIQFVLTQIGCLKSGADFEAMVGKFALSFFWFTFCFYVMTNGPAFLQQVGLSATTLASAIAGSSFDPGHIVDVGSDLAGNVWTSINAAASGILPDFAAALASAMIVIVILITTALVAFNIFLLALEIQLVVMMSPLSFAFLGLNALKDQGIAPFKSIIALVYRAILLSIVVKSMVVMGDAVMAAMHALPDAAKTDGGPSIYSGLWASAIGFGMIGFLAFKSHSIASSMASGTANLGASDAAQYGAALVAASYVANAGVGAVANGLGAVADAAGKMPGTMGSVIGKMTGDGSVSEGGAGKGSGKSDAPVPPPTTDAEKGKKPTPPESKGAANDSSGKDAAIGGGNTGSNGSGIGSSLTALGGKMGAFNQHVAQQQATTGVSINTSNSHE